LSPDPDMVLRWDSVHDGWGVAHEEGLKGDAIEAGTTTNMDTIAKENAYRTLAAHGVAVGLSDGLMGNSEVGSVLSVVLRHLTGVFR
jgi:bisphosphoglycerate-independent phosphoglycerate mutase (AlkP superfamily)